MSEKSHFLKLYFLKVNINKNLTKFKFFSVLTYYECLVRFVRKTLHF